MVSEEESDEYFSCRPAGSKVKRRSNVVSHFDLCPRRNQFNGFVYTPLWAPNTSCRLTQLLLATGNRLSPAGTSTSASKKRITTLPVLLFA